MKISPVRKSALFLWLAVILGGIIVVADLMVELGLPRGVQYVFNFVYIFVMLPILITLIDHITNDGGRYS